MGHTERGVRRVLLGVVFVSLCLPASSLAASPTKPYIIVLDEEVSDPAAVARDHARRLSARPKASYRSALKAYAAAIPEDRVDDVRRDRRVAYVEPDRPVSVAGQSLPWGVNKIDADRSSMRSGDGRGRIGKGNAYILDTGIDARHRDLNVVGGVNLAGGPGGDCHGHGTHVAGTLGSRDNARAVVSPAPSTHWWQ